MMQVIILGKALAKLEQEVMELKQVVEELKAKVYCPPQPIQGGGSVGAEATTVEGTVGASKKPKKGLNRGAKIAKSAEENH